MLLSVDLDRYGFFRRDLIPIRRDQNLIHRDQKTRVHWSPNLNRHRIVRLNDLGRRVRDLHRYHHDWNGS